MGGVSHSQLWLTEIERYAEYSARFEHPGGFRHGRRFIRLMFDHRKAGYGVEGVVGKRQLFIGNDSPPDLQLLSLLYPTPQWDVFATRFNHHYFGAEQRKQPGHGRLAGTDIQNFLVLQIDIAKTVEPYPGVLPDLGPILVISVQFVVFSQG